MKTWRVEVSPGVGERLVGILTNIFDAPLHNPDAARAVFEDFDATMSLDAVEAGLCETIIEKLVEDIFNATVAQW